MRAANAEAALRDQIGTLRAESDRFNALLRSEPQILVSWAAADNEPDIVGDTTLVTNAPAPQRVLAFGTWLEPDKAQAMERAVDALRANGESFSMQLMTLAGHAIEADGRVIGGRAVLRLRDVSGVKRELAELNVRHEKLTGEMESLRALIDALPSPVWARDLAGALVFVNPAYARAVEAKDPADAHRPRRRTARAGRRARRPAARAPPARSMPAARAGDRRRQPPHARRDRRADPPGQRRHRHRRHRSRGDARRAQAPARRASPHARPAPDRRRDLRRRPASWRSTTRPIRSLWDLDAGFLDQAPTDSALLDQLARRAQAARGAGLPRMEGRAARSLSRDRNPASTSGTCPTAARCASSPRPIRRAASPTCSTTSPSGCELVRRYDALIRVQGETLDNLAEGVAVFGSDGRLRLHNSGLRADVAARRRQALAEHPHIETVIAAVPPPA